MARPCTVCAHPKRADIDQLLAHQVVNVKHLAESFGIGRDSMARHRAKHLPAFLPALTARAETLSLDVVQAEAQRLYMIALDALAQAEAGSVISVAADGSVVRAVSSTAVARLLREARSALDTLAKLAIVGADPGGTPAGTTNAGLDERIAAALDRVAQRALPPTLDVEEAVMVEGDERVVASVADRAGATGAGGTPGPSTGSTPPPRAYELPLDTDAQSGGSQAPEETPREVIIAEHIKSLGPMSPAASREELKAAGIDIEAIDQAIALRDAPERDGYTYRMGESEPPR